MSAVSDYCEAVAASLRRILGEPLTGLYLHGSAAMGGWHPALSDIDLLAIATRALTFDEKQRIAAVLTTMPAPGKGIEFSLVVDPTLEPLSNSPPFELHIATSASPPSLPLAIAMERGPGGEARVIDGAGHPGDSDLVMHYAVCRERGIAIFGPPPAEVFPQVPRQMLLRAVAEELAWGLKNAPARYAVLNACRAWALAEGAGLLSKIEGGEWALGHRIEQQTIRLALAAQRGELPQPAVAGARRIVAHGTGRLRAALSSERS